MGLLQDENIWEPAYHLQHAKEAVTEFYQTHPTTVKPTAMDLKAPTK